MKIRLHPEASKEVSEAVQWYEGQQAGLGQRFADEAEAAIYRIAAFPDINSEISKGFRRGIMADTIIHGASLYPYQTDRTDCALRRRLARMGD